MATAGKIVILRIELQGIEPLIWRRVSVSAGTNLAGVHRIIQAAMGWLDCHLWNFEVSGRKYGMHLPDDPEWNERIENAGTITLQALLRAGERHMQYVYDMGDFWEHSIIFEKVTVPVAETSYPQFLGGERRCPPEDCGGPFGYGEFLRKISSKQRKTREGALDWYGGPYDPDDIGERKVITDLGRIASGRAKR
jgi:Plasmid pRiA4b ORF-3-like protein